jgi:hypothetical protein
LTSKVDRKWGCYKKKFGVDRVKETRGGIKQHGERKTGVPGERREWMGE